MILMYHNVVPAEAGAGHDLQSITLREAAFRSQVARLSRWVEFVDVDEYLARWREAGRQPRRAAVITFDDGTWATHEFGVRRLVEMGIPSVVFVNTCQIDDGPLIWGAFLNALCCDSDHAEVSFRGLRLPLDTPANRVRARAELARVANASGDPRETVAELASSYAIDEEVLRHYKGMSSEQLAWAGGSELVEIGAHTHTHPRLSRLAREWQAHEIRLNRERLAALTGAEVRFMAYPFGDYNRDTVDVVQSMGFEAAFAVHPLPVEGSAMFQLPRVGVFSTSAARVMASAVRAGMRGNGRGVRSL